MAESVVSLTYGNALFEAAKDLGKENDFLTELALLDAVLKEENEIGEFLNSPAIPGDEKKKIISETLKGNLSEEMLNFLFVLIDKGRTSEISKIRRQYIRLYDAEMGVAEGEIFSAEPLSEDRLLRFEEELSKLMRKNIKLENIVDKSLIGGVKIQVDGKMIDKSLRADLDNLLRKLKKM